MTQGTVCLNIEGGIASVLFDRPQARNAMTWAMYEQLMAICRQLAADPSVRVVSFRGAGGEAFVARTDIEQFKAFSTGDDGVAYELERRLLAKGAHAKVYDYLEMLPAKMGTFYRAFYAGQLRVAPSSYEWLYGKIDRGVLAPIARS